MNLPKKLSDITKVFDEMNRPHRERHQEKVGKVLFEWWWTHTMHAHADPGVEPMWDECSDHAQAHWMEGARRVMSVG